MTNMLLNNGVATLTGKEDTFADTFVFWYHVDVVYEKIYQFLKIKFPDSNIVEETIGNIDLAILDQNLPIEIQSTLIGGRGKTPYLNRFEKDTHLQIKQDIETFGKCWLFIDSEFLRYLQIQNKILSVDLTWLYKYIKDEKLKVFTVSHTGDIKERSCEDFEFISDISMTCTYKENSDDRILEKNRMKIYNAVFIGQNFTTEEYHNIKLNFSNRQEDGKYEGLSNWLLRNGRTDREFLLYCIINAVANVQHINKIIDCNSDVCHLQEMETLGIIEINYKKGKERIGNKNIRICFVDKFDILKYLPGYIRNKTIWDELKRRCIYINYMTTFRSIVTGQDTSWLDIQKDIVDGWTSES